MTQPTGPRRPVAPTTTARPPVATGRPLTTASRPVAAPGRRPVTTAAPTATTAIRRPVPQTTSAIRRPGTQVITSTRRPGTQVVTSTRRAGAPPTTHKRVTGWPYHGKKLSQARPVGTTTVHRKHPGGGTAVTRQGRHIPHTTGARISHAPGRSIPGRRHVRYAPGTPGRRTVYYPGAPGSVDYIEHAHPGQPMPAGGSISPGQPVQAPIARPRQAGNYGTCPSAGPAPITGPIPTAGPAPAPTAGTMSTTSTPRPCHNCGTSVRGCTTLSRFAFNSAELKNSHKSQLRALAERILKQSSNAVIATGHTDSSGTEDYNEALGERRAAAVVKELKKQLALLKPGSQKALFWKTDSKGETRPVSDADAAANRRVTICVRKGSFAR